MKRAFKPYFFRAITLIAVCIVVEAIGYTGVWIHSRAVDVLANKNYSHIRSMLMGDRDPEMFPRYLSLPYLGYVPYPGYKNHGVVQHNQDGYRGTRIPLDKGTKYRIICMGGSTTYGFGVDSPAQAYPAQLEKMLNASLAHDSIFQKKYGGVEVMNAGLEGGNSAEELQQYLFKYRYYKANAVILHSGINDAQLVAQASGRFQPDYTHYRRINFHLEPLPQPGRFLMHSYFISFIVIRLFYDDFSNTEDFQSQRKTFCKWSADDINQIVKNKKYQEYPFYQNTKTLVSEILRDSTTLIVFPNAANTNVAEKKYKETCELNARLSHAIADEQGAVFAPFSFDAIDSDLWMDDCHLIPAGETKKAGILLPSVLTAIRNSTR